MSVAAISKALQARLRQVLIDAPTAAGQPALAETVYSAREYDAVAENNMLCPSVAVIYSGYTPIQRPGQAANQANRQQVGFQFLVVLNVSSAYDTATAEGIQDEVSPLFDAVLKALLGFRPLQGFLPMTLDPAPGAAVSSAGFGYYPIAFTTAASYVGTP
ncbi:hypothetical protein HXXDennis_26 [Xanthomonas phage HXX_Dennis]|nr:hypothetical protein CPT_Suso_025 [Stenotrophomonas phage Suso]TXH02743.1 MAG: hypothetical protein E6R07_14550 [Nevskiaceae bacterium]UTQ79913.1 hypothetical protein HXXDennis_26 [Xanthomonas phage HXX_Dennis]